MRNFTGLLFISGTICLFASCSLNHKYEEEEKSLIQHYAITHNITTDSDADGLYYIEKAPGTGDPISVGDSIGVYYSMKYLDDTEVYSNKNEDTPLRFRVGSLGMIDGWTIGLTYMRAGGDATFIIPSSLAYGPEGFGYYDEYGKYITVIKGYTPLIYEIEIVETFNTNE